MKKNEKQDLFIRNARVGDVDDLKKIAKDNDVCTSRAFDLVMEALRESGLKVTKKTMMVKK